MKSLRSWFVLISALFVAICLLMQTTASYAVNPNEMLPDPAMEKRARQISSHLRCMVCQNESIDDSNADLAKDLRLLVRDRLKAGDTDEQVVDFVVARYGEFVLLKPRLNAHTMLLWSFPALVLLIGLITLLVALRRRKSGLTGAEQPLSEAEQADLKRVLNQNSSPNN